MVDEADRWILLASGEPALLAAVEPVLADPATRVQVTMTAEAALAAMLKSAPALALVDSRLPGMSLGQLLAAVRGGRRRFPIVLISDTVSEELKARLIEGVVDDLVSPDIGAQWLRLRLEMALHAAERMAELERLRDQISREAERDSLTGTWNRNALMGMLFRETDRVQRLNTELCYILLDIDDFGHWNARLGTAACDELLVNMVERLGALLRSYDLLGRVGKDEFLVGLPGCSAVNAARLVERMRTEVFAEPYVASGRMVRLSACFAVVASRGRSPLVVLREAEEILHLARTEGPETIRCAGECPEARDAAVEW